MINSSKFLWHMFPKSQPLLKWRDAVDILRRKVTLDDQLDPKDLNEALLVLLTLCGDMATQMLLLECILQLPHVQKVGEWLSQHWFYGMPQTLKTFNELFLKFDCQHSKRVFYRLFLNKFNMEIKNSPNFQNIGTVTSIPVLRATWDGAKLKPRTPESLWLDINMGASHSLSFFVEKASFLTQESKCESTSGEMALIVIPPDHISDSCIVSHTLHSEPIIEFLVELDTSHLLILVVEGEYELLLTKTLSDFGLCVKKIGREDLVVPPQTPNPTPNECYCWVDGALRAVDSAISRVSFLSDQSEHMTLSPPGHNSSELSRGQSEQENKSNVNKSNQQCTTTELEPLAATGIRALSAEPKSKVEVKSGKRREKVKRGQGQNRKRKLKDESIGNRVITRSAQRKEEVTENIKTTGLPKKLRAHLPSFEIQSVTHPGYSCESGQSEILFVKEESEALQIEQEREAESEDSKPCVNLYLAQQSLGESHIKLEPTQSEIPCCKIDSSVLPATSEGDTHIVPELSCADTEMKELPEKNPSIVTAPAQNEFLLIKVESEEQELSEGSPLNMSQFSHSLKQQSSPPEELACNPLSQQSEVQTDIEESTSVVHFSPENVNACVEVNTVVPLPQKLDVQVVYESNLSPILGKKLPSKTLHHNSIPSSSRTQCDMPKGVPLDIGFKHRNSLNFLKNPYNPAHESFVYQVKSSVIKIATGGNTPETNESSLTNVPHDNSEELSAPKTSFLVLNEQKCSEGNESPRQCGDAGARNIYDHSPSMTSVKEHDYNSQHPDSDTTSVTAIPYSGGSVAVKNNPFFEIYSDVSTSEDL